MRTRRRLRLAAGAAAMLAVALTAGSAPSARGGGALRIMVRVTVRIQGGGAVTLAGKTCTRTCSVMLEGGKVVTATARAGDDFEFDGWRGGCFGTAQRCAVYGLRGATVIARFTRVLVPVDVTVGGPGTVGSPAGGIHCGTGGSRCTGLYGLGSLLRLVQTADQGAAFARWGGDCSGTDVCTLRVQDGSEVTALFRTGSPAGSATVRLQIDRTGPIVAPVNASFGSITCLKPCTQEVPTGTVGTLTGGYVVGWRGACVGRAAVCPLALDQDTAVTVEGGAPFKPPTTAGVGVTVTIFGRGRVVARGAGIDCRVPQGSIDGCRTFGRRRAVVVLKAVAAPGMRFRRWAGDCIGKGASCRLTLYDASSVNAVFAR